MDYIISIKDIETDVELNYDIPKSLSKLTHTWIGTGDFSMTKKLYSHVPEYSKKEISDKIDNIFTKKGEKEK